MICLTDEVEVALTDFYRLLQKPHYNLRRLKRDSPNFYDELDSRGININFFRRLLNRITDIVGQRAIWPSAIVCVFIAFFVGKNATCESWFSSYSECHDEAYKEHRETTTPPGGSIDTQVQKSTNKGANFNGSAFTGALGTFAFVLAFARWHVANKQAAMSEMFERKKSSNMLIISNKNDVEDLIKDAIVANLIKRRQIVELMEKMSYNDCKKARAAVDEVRKTNPFGLKEPTTIQRVFVYLELDNLEFAHNKFCSGYLDPEQLFRACEIFEARCRSRLFFFIAANQGLTYYTERFHRLLTICLLFGYSASSIAKQNEA